MNEIAESIPGNSDGDACVPRSSVSMRDLETLKLSVGFTNEDERYLNMAGEVLTDQTENIVADWRAGTVFAPKNDDVAPSLIEVWIDHAERRTWFLGETVREG